MNRGHGACWAAGEEIQDEHAAMLRQWSACQQRVSQLVRDYHQQIAALQAEVLRLRAQQMVATTRRLWALDRPAVVLPTPSPALQAQAPSVLVRATAAAALASEHPWQTLAAAAQVICRTGCISHAHHWLEGAHCRLHGQACEQVAAVTPPAKPSR